MAAEKGAVPHIPSDEIVATNVSDEEFMAHYAETFHEWVEGTVIKMSPVSDKHVALSLYLSTLLSAYLALRPIGALRTAPFLMRIDAINLKREPDLQVILNTNPGNLTPTFMDGPADICIEIVSPESVQRDLSEKLLEYEKGKVGEYWIIDPVHRGAHFYRLDGATYLIQNVDSEGNYATPLLPSLKIHIPTLWTEPLPDIFAAVNAVRDMLK